MSTIFVRNLPWSTTNDELREFFSSNLKFEVTSAEVQFNKQGRSKGWALVSFANAEGAQAAINTLNDADFTSGDNTRQLQIREDRGAKAPRVGGNGAAGAAPVEAEPSTSLFVGNLPWRTSWQDLKDMFSDYNVQYTTIKTGYDGRSRGYGIARFDTIEEAEKAIEGMNGKEYHGRTITVRFDSKPRAPRPQQNDGAAAVNEVAQEFNADAATYQEAPGAGAAGAAATGPLGGGYQQF